MREHSSVMQTTFYSRCHRHHYPLNPAKIAGVVHGAEQQPAGCLIHRAGLLGWQWMHMSAEEIFQNHPCQRQFA